MDTINVALKLTETKVIKTETNEFDEIFIYVETIEEFVKCRLCKNKIYKRHGSDRERKLKYLPLFGNHTYIVYSPHRYICEECQDNPTLSDPLILTS